GLVHLLKAQSVAGKNRRMTRALSGWSDEPLAPARWPTATQFIKARLSSMPIDDLIALDPPGRQLHILTRTPGSNGALLPSGEFDSDGSRTKTFSLDLDNEPIAALPLKLNGDPTSDLVVLRRGQAAPIAVNSGPNAIITVNSNLDSNERDNKLTLREAI